jgi:hypothetical protein
MESVRLHAVAVAGLTVLVALILHVIGVLDYPFDSGYGYNRRPSSKSYARSRHRVAQLRRIPLPRTRVNK